MASVPNYPELSDWILKNNRLPVRNTNERVDSLENKMFDFLEALRVSERKILEYREKQVTAINELFEWIKSHNGSKPRMNSKDHEEVRLAVVFMSAKEGKIYFYSREQFISKLNELGYMDLLNY